MIAIDPLYVLSGFVVGALVGMTGVGGGSLMTPLLILLFGIHPATAVGTDLLYAAATKCGGSLVHGLKRNIEWRIVALLAMGSVPLTVVTVAVLARYQFDQDAVRTAITTALGVALFLTAIALIFRSRIVDYFEPHMRRVGPRRRDALTILTGAILGVLVSLSSVGAGALGVTALIILHPDLPSKRIVGSDIAHAVPLALLAGIGHWYLGSINWPLLEALLVGSLPGIVLGSLAATRMPDAVLRPVLAGILLIVGGRLLF